MSHIIQICPADNVAVAIHPIAVGTTATTGADKVLKAIEEIPAGHKIALSAIKQGETLIKYGNSIGLATADIAKGSLVHTHNMKTALDGISNYAYEPVNTSMNYIPPADFMGYRRDNNGVGIRNYIWIIPTVGCVNHIATTLATRATPRVKGTVDAIVAFPHPYGCSQLGMDQENTRKILADLINHPNAGGVLVLGLGCENSGVNELEKYIGAYNAQRVKFLVCQDVMDEMETGLALLDELITYASAGVRTKIPVSELIVGLKCGGSDGFSGITANPVVGRFSDLILSQGATTILTEVPEMFGAEQGLMNRCINLDIYEKTVHMINDFKKYFMDCHQPIYENPSPGNKSGGISSLEDKSLGCTQKSGHAPVMDVLKYGERVTTKGLNLLSAPGNDLVAATALAASGAQLILFTTGRGTPFASPVPTVKISSNSNLTQRKPGWIDFDAGPVLDGVALDEMGQCLLEEVITIASGQKVKSEEMGFHDLAIFKQGVTL